LEKYSLSNSHYSNLTKRPQGKGQLYKNIGNTNNNNPSAIEQLKSNLGSNLFLVYDGDWKNGMKNG
jgi:hypothetical protein